MQICPSVSLYTESEKGFEVYLGKYSTLQGLKSLHINVNVKLLEFGATNYKHFGYATVEDIPAMQTSEDVILFFENERNVDVIHFEVMLEGLGTMSTHDDGECHFIFYRYTDAMALLKSVVPFEYSGLLIARMIAGQGSYFTIDAAGSILRFATFEQYLEYFESE